MLNHGKSPLFMGKLTISMAIFYSTSHPVGWPKDFTEALGRRLQEAVTDLALQIAHGRRAVRHHDGAVRTGESRGVRWPEALEAP